MRSPALPCILAALWGGVAAAGPTESYSVRPAPQARYSISAVFTNFNSDPLTLVFSLERGAVTQSMEEFGYSEAELRHMAHECVTGGCNQAEYDRREARYYRERGIMREQTRRGYRMTVDMPAIVARNKPRLSAAAAALERLADARRYDADKTFGAALAFVQTALDYRRPPDTEGARELLGFYPPPRALVAGAGDCDTKSALLAALMANFSGVKMVGVHVPGHYLIGIGRVPRAGDAAIEYRGEPYVLVEPAGPAWLPPGTIGDRTQAALETLNGVRIDPLF